MSFAPTSMLSDGFFLSLSLCLDIGLVNVAMLSLTLSHGFRPGFWLGVGSCVGDLVYAALALAGMAVLLRFEAVRWVVWLGGGAPAALARASTSRNFARGMLLAMSSPSAILWFAAVGGALIAKAGATTPASASVFLSGFFLGGLAWTLFLCTLASQGRKRAGAGLMRACHVVSALLFAYFAYSVIVGGYRDLILNAAA